MKKNVELWRAYHETYQDLYGNSPKDIFPQRYGHDHLIEHDQYGQSINDLVLEFNGHEMSNESNLGWNEKKFIIGQELQFFFFFHQRWNPRKIPINFPKMKH
jgi:hypothetical protein